MLDRTKVFLNIKEGDTCREIRGRELVPSKHNGEFLEKERDLEWFYYYQLYQLDNLD